MMRLRRKNGRQREKYTLGLSNSNRKLHLEALEDRRLLATFHNDTPLTIVDNATVTSEIFIQDSIEVKDINVSLSIQHTHAADLDVFLVFNNTRVELFSDVGGNGDNFSGTTLDDEATTAIGSGSAPFSGSYRPVGDLSAFDGTTTDGTWVLEITDDRSKGRSRGGGTLESWSLDLPDIVYSDFSDTTGLSLVNDAMVGPDNQLRLTENLGGLEGAAWHREKQYVAVDFSTSFQFQLTEGRGGSDNSDGFTFAIQNYSDTALAGGGGTLGYQFPNSLVIEFDTHTNGEIGDPNDNHVSVHSQGTNANSWDHSTSLGWATSPFNMTDGAIHSARIDYTPGSLRLFLDGSNSPTLDVDVDLAQLLELDEGKAWIGFTAATGGGWQNHDILNWEYSTNTDTSNRISITDAELVEGDNNTRDLVFTVEWNGNQTGSSTVNFSTRDASNVLPEFRATEGTDYIAATGSLTFDAANTTREIRVAVNDDTDEEFHELLEVELSGATNAALIDRIGIGTILNDEATATVNEATVLEGDTTLRFSDEFIPAETNALAAPRGMVVVGNDLYVASAATNEIIKFDLTTGKHLGVIADSSDGLDHPRGIALGPNNTIYVASSRSDSIIVIDLDTLTATPFIGPEDGLVGPRGLHFDGGYLYVTNAGTGEVLRFASDGTPDSLPFISALGNPSRIIKGPDGLFYVSATSSTDNAVHRFDANGNFVDTFAKGGHLDGPVDLDFQGNDLVVTSWRNDSVVAYDTTGQNSPRQLITPGQGGLDTPIDLVITDSGDFLVGSYRTNAILRYGAGSVASVNFELSHPLPTVVLIEYQEAPGTPPAISGVDYSLPTPHEIVIVEGRTSATLRIPTMDNSAREEDKEFTLAITAAPSNVAYTSTPQSITIIDNEPRVSLLDASATENNLSSNLLDRFAQGAAGQLAQAYGLTTDAEGNYYVVGSQSNNVLKYSSSGEYMDEFVASGVGGLTAPKGIAFAPNGDLWVASSGNGSLVRFDGTTGQYLQSIEGLSQPNDVAFSNGVLYATSPGANEIRRFDADTLQPLVAWQGGVSGPTGIAFDAANNLYTHSRNSDEIYRYDTNGTASVFVAAGTSGLDSGETLAFDPNGILFATGQGTSLDRILRFDPTGQPLPDFGAAALINQPRDILFSPAGIDIVGRNGSIVVRLDNTTAEITDIVIRADSGIMDSPTGIAVNSNGDILVGSGHRNSIARFDSRNGEFIDHFSESADTSLTTIWGVTLGPDDDIFAVSKATDEILRFDGGTGAFEGVYLSGVGTGMNSPNYIAFDSSGTAYITNHATSEVYRYDGSTLTLIADTSDGLDRPWDLAILPNGNLAVTNLGYDNVLEITPDGNSVTELIQTGAGGVDAPVGLAIWNDHIYVASRDTDSILRYDLSGTFVEVVANSNDGIDSPADLTFDDLGVLYVVSRSNHSVLRFVTESHLVFEAKLENAYPASVEGTFETITGSADNDDFVMRTGTWNFPAGSTSQFIVIPTKNDQDSESDESMTLTIDYSVSSTPYSVTAAGNILDDETGSVATKFFVVDSGTDETFRYTPTFTEADSPWSLAAGNPRGVAALPDGSAVYVVDNNDRVYVFDSAGAPLGSWQASGLRRAAGIATDGTDVWIVDSRSKVVLRFENAADDPTTEEYDPITSGNLSADHQFSLWSGHEYPTGMTTDGQSLWITDDDKGSNDDNVWKYNLNGDLDGGWSLDASNQKPTGITIDPAGQSNNIWIVDTATDQVFEYQNALGTEGGPLIATHALSATNTNPQGIADPRPFLAAPDTTPISNDSHDEFDQLLDVLVIAERSARPVERFQLEERDLASTFDQDSDIETQLIALNNFAREKPQSVEPEDPFDDQDAWWRRNELEVDWIEMGTLGFDGE